MAEVSWEPFDRERGVFEVCMKGVPLKSVWSDNCMKGAPLKIMWSANQFIFVRRHGWRIARGELLYPVCQTTGRPVLSSVDKDKASSLKLFMCLAFACFALPVLSFLLKRTDMKSKEFEFQKDRCDIWAIEIEPRKQIFNICLSVRCQKEWPNKPLSVYFNAVDGEKTSVFGVIVLRPRPYVYGCFSLRIIPLTARIVFQSNSTAHKYPDSL